MKILFRFFNAAVMVAGMCIAFTACDPEVEATTEVITFEDVTLNSSGIWNGSDLTGDLSSYMSWGTIVNDYSGAFHSGTLSCSNDFLQDQTYFSTWWTGMACSNNTNMDSVGYGNQYSVYATSGAGGSEKFALVGSDSAICTFTAPVNVKSLMFNNSTYVYWALKEGNDGTGLVTKFAPGDFFYVTVTGVDADQSETGQVVITLADFRGSKTYICSDWTKKSLESLGKVKTLRFTFTSSDSGLYGMNTPAYLCIDNIEYEK